jgi:hypothetical protein
MGMKRIILAISAVSVIFSGCANVPKSPSDRNLKAIMYSTAVEKSSIYVFRNKRFSSALSIALLVDGKILGQSEPFTYFLIDIEPGRHNINCDDNTNESFVLTTKPGQIYYVRLVMKNGFSSVSCKFQEVAATEGKDAVNGCDLAQNIP